jgi:hypothetical protein
MPCCRQKRLGSGFRKRIAALFSTTDQASQKTQTEGLGKISNEQLSQMLVEVARRLAG